MSCSLNSLRGLYRGIYGTTTGVTSHPVIVTIGDNLGRPLGYLVFSLMAAIGGPIY